MRLNQKMLLQKQQANEEARRETQPSYTPISQLAMTSGQLPASVPTGRLDFQQVLVGTDINSLPGSRTLGMYDIAPSACGNVPVGVELDAAISSICEHNADDFVPVKLEDILGLTSVDASAYDLDLDFDITQLSNAVIDSEHLSNQSIGGRVLLAQSCPADVSIISPGDAVSPRLTPTHRATRHASVTSDDSQVWVKDRIRKDNHNKIERRRRYNINDRIKDLEALLPPSPDMTDCKLNKGLVLKSSVDYIRALRKDQEQLSQVTGRLKQVEDTNRKLLLHIRNLEVALQSSGISHPLLDQTSSAQLLTEMTALKEMQLQQQLAVKQEPGIVLTHASMSGSEMVGDDDMSPLTPSPHPQQQMSPLSMLDSDDMFY